MRTSDIFGRLANFTTIALIISYQAFSVNLTLKPVSDTSLFEFSPNNNLGKTTLSAGSTQTGSRSRALIRFDLGTNLPPGAIITNVTLTFKIDKTPAVSPASSTFSLAPMLLSWTEGTHGGIGRPAYQGGTATSGETTWNERAKGSLAWGAPGGKAGVDYSSKMDATVTVANTMTFPSNTNLISTVQQWLANSNSNFGWILICNSESTPLTGRRFGSRESSTLNQPSLVIGYTVPLTAVPPVISTQPSSGVHYAGETAQLQVAATGDSPLSYQWFLGAAPISGATASSLSITNFQASNAGSYSATVSNAGGTTSSSAATLSFVAAPKIDSFQFTATNTSVTFTAHPNHIFTLQGVTAIGGTNWANLSSLTATNLATALTLQAPSSSNTLFLRLAVQAIP